MWVSLRNKIKPHSYTEHSGVNQAGISVKDYALNRGGLTDVWRMYKDCKARSKACREKSAEAIVPKSFF